MPMKIQEKIKKDLTAAIKAKDEPRKSALRVIMGEFGRLDKKVVADQEVVAIIRKLIKAERETLETKGEEGSEFLEICESYLPRTASEEEIAAWIEKNIDFSKFKNKMQAMRPIMAHFGARADGNAVKEILQKFNP
jgi:uncharacterized protein YqeY